MLKHHTSSESSPTLKITSRWRWQVLLSHRELEATTPVFRIAKILKKAVKCLHVTVKVRY